MSMYNITTPTRPTRRERPRTSSLAVLIEVPAVAASTRTARRFDPGTDSRRPRVNRTGTARPRTAPPKRRLRREVRLTARVFLALAVVAGSATLLGTTRPGRAAQHRSPRPTDPRVAVSAEPALAAPAVDLARPVVFPGYLLPDDALEAPDHEGG